LNKSNILLAYKNFILVRKDNTNHELIYLFCSIRFPLDFWVF